MNKLKLNLDDLKVDSFNTTAEDDKKRSGTAFGYGEDTQPWRCDPNFTEEFTCQGYGCTNVGFPCIA